MRKITYNDLWIKSESELEEITEDETVDKSLRAIAYIKLKKIVQAQQLLSEVKEITAEAMDANLLMMLPMPEPKFNECKFNEMVNKANEIMKLNQSMLGANLVLSDYYRINKQEGKMLAYCLKVLDISPLNERAFHNAVAIASQGKVVSDNRLILESIRRFRASALKQSTPFTKRIYYTILTIWYEMFIRLRSFFGVLILMGILGLVTFNVIPVPLYISLFFIAILNALLFIITKNKLAVFISIWFLLTMLIFWIFGFLIRWMTTLKN